MTTAVANSAFDLNAVLSRLATDRPLFHSEADFQFALAWEIQQAHPDYRVRLEWPIKVGTKRAYIDLLVKNPQARGTAIELKYWTKRFMGEVLGERFDLPNQAAQDISRYDFWKDVARLERLVREGMVNEGFAIALTNDPGYWRVSRAATADKAFRLREGREVTGTLAWAPSAGTGTTKGREAAISLGARYQLNWQQYSLVEVGTANRFRYLSFKVAKGIDERLRS